MITNPINLITEEEKEAISKLRTCLNEKWEEGSEKVSQKSTTEESTNSEKLDAIESIESVSHSYNFTDTMILRFYRGRKCDFKRTLRALQRHIQWRHENSVDSITVEDVSSEVNCGKIFLQGRDALDRPCVTILARKHRKDARDLDVMKKAIIFTLEEVIKLSIPEEEKIVIVFDLHEFSFACMDYEVIKILIDILQYNYPETLSVAIILNAPFLFSACWLLIKPWLDPETGTKVIFLNSKNIGNYVTSLPSEVRL